MRHKDLLYLAILICLMVGGLDLYFAAIFYIKYRGMSFRVDQETVNLLWDAAKQDNLEEAAWHGLLLALAVGLLVRFLIVNRKPNR